MQQSVYDSETTLSNLYCCNRCVLDMKNHPLIAKLMALVVLLGANLSAGVLERR